MNCRDHEQMSMKVVWMGFLCLSSLPSSTIRRLQLYPPRHFSIQLLIYLI